MSPHSLSFPNCYAVFFYYILTFSVRITNVTIKNVDNAVGVYTLVCGVETETMTYYFSYKIL